LLALLCKLIIFSYRIIPWSLIFIYTVLLFNYCLISTVKELSLHDSLSFCISVWNYLFLDIDFMNLFFKLYLYWCFHGAPFFENLLSFSWYFLSSTLINIFQIFVNGLIIRFADDKSWTPSYMFLRIIWYFIKKQFLIFYLILFIRLDGLVEVYGLNYFRIFTCQIISLLSSSFVLHFSFRHSCFVYYLRSNPIVSFILWALTIFLNLIVWFLNVDMT